MLTARLDSLGIADVVCYINKDDSVECSGAVIVMKDRGVFLLHVPKRVDVVFVHDVSKIPICQGHGFQVHVWGLHRYTIWSINGNVVPCVVLNRVFIDMCGDNVLAVSHNPLVCGSVKLNSCESEFSELLKLHEYPLFILVGISRRLPILNVVNHEDPYECIEKKNFLLDK